MGITPVQNFRMIERHYFKGRLLRSYDFTFGFVIPGSTNSWEALYETPNMTEEVRKSDTGICRQCEAGITRGQLAPVQEIEDFVASPYEHHSDTFYFVGGELIMHNKALFSYYAD